MAPPWSTRKDGVALAVRLTPKSSRDEIIGIESLADGRAILKVKVRAVPEDGAANAALLRLLAKTLSLPVSHLSLESGATNRLKSVHLSGESVVLAAKLAALFG